MSKNKYIIITLDGAAGSGKSTTANLISKKFNYIHVDTGLHYRSLALFFLNKNISPKLVPEFLNSGKIKLGTQLDGFNARLSLNGNCYSSEDLRTEKMNHEVSFFARLPEIRNLLLKYQRGLCDFGKSNHFRGIVMDGRDIGSVVLPDADLRFFLHADIAIRQQRRLLDGEDDSISARDKVDTTRKIAPLLCPDGAISIDTGLNSLDIVISIISKEIYKLRE